MIVVDHHVAEPALPRAIAVVNPNRLDDRSGQGTLAAIGVTFLLTVATNRILRDSGWYDSSGRKEPDLLGLLDPSGAGYSVRCSAADGSEPSLREPGTQGNG